MFIRKHTNGGYTRDGQQRSGRGDYLALFSWNEYKAEDEIRAACVDCAAIAAAYQRVYAGEINPPAEILERMRTGDRYCVLHSYTALRVAVQSTVHKYSNGTPMLWAIVRSCSLRQCGHWMMGSIRIGDASITVSGPIGSDGLPMDYQKVPAKYRHLLVQVPEDVAAIYWKDDGHNSIGRAAPDVRKWALSVKWQGK